MAKFSSISGDRAAAGTNPAITLSAIAAAGLVTKIHAAVDGHGRPLVILLTPGQVGDAPMKLPLLAGLRVGRPLGGSRWARIACEE